MIAKPHATVQDLYNVPDNGKAELVGGEIVRMRPTGAKLGRAGMKIVSSLQRHEEEQGGGYAIPDNVGFVVNLPDRGSFSPDAAWYTGDVDSMKFLTGAPVFAVEIRSENDYGPAAERAITKKISDYFAAGTLVVWDVDLLSEDTIKSWRSERPDTPTVYRRGEMADAEPAVPDWRFAVEKMFT